MTTATKKKPKPKPAPKVRETWPESTVIAEPVGPKKLDAPRVLVRRNAHMLLGPRNQDLITLPGQPVISLFTGAGGFDLGVEQAGMCCVVQHEWDQAACETLIMNRPNFFRDAALIQGDIRKTPTEMLLQEANLRVGEACLVIGGPPCQGFSTSGKRRIGDERNDLVFEYLRVVRDAKPSFFIMENVPGFTDFNKGEYFKAFLKQAYDCYYELVYGLVDAVEYGVPQNRCRFICMGTRRDLWACEGIIASLPAPETFGAGDLCRIKAAPDMALTLFPDEEVRWLTHPPGIRYFPDRPILVPPRPIANRCDDTEAGRSRTFINFYSRLAREEPDRLVQPLKAGTVL